MFLIQELYPWLGYIGSNACRFSALQVKAPEELEPHQLGRHEENIISSVKQNNMN